MGLIRTFNPVKLFVGVLVSDADWIPELEARLSSEYGPIDLRFPAVPFTFTDYYRYETGDNILRAFFAFERLIDADRLPEIKIWTNALESEFATAGANVKRPVNLDPGYVENPKVVLASAKNFYHKIYLGRGIFGDVTMYFRSNNTCEFFPWTYPDYKSAPYQEYFLKLRRVYREQLKTMCVIKQKK